jgi:hypothetical protein
MSKVKIQGNASGTGVVTLTAPNTNTDRTITLPDGTGTLVQADASGNVGIGTNPDTNSLLHLKRTTADCKLTIETDESHDAYINFSGATSEMSLGYEPTTNSFIIANASDGITSAERMRINSAGIVTMPNQPAFSANKSSTGATNTTLVFNQANVNVGSHYSESTGRFTAPVDGQYMFTFYAMSDSSTNMRVTIQINGAVYTGGEHLGGVGYTNGVTYSQVEINTILTLSASDYVSIFNNSGYSAIHPDHNKFSGHLIG